MSLLPFKDSEAWFLHFYCQIYIKDVSEDKTQLSLTQSCFFNTMGTPEEEKKESFSFHVTTRGALEALLSSEMNQNKTPTRKLHLKLSHVCFTQLIWKGYFKNSLSIIINIVYKCWLHKFQHDSDNNCMPVP